MKNEERVINLDEAHELGASLLVEGRFVRVKLGGSSMFPLLRPGDVAKIKLVPLSELNVGQVIVFENSGKWIAHRLVSIGGKGGQIQLLAQGDSVRKADPSILENHYLGLIESFSRNGREHKMDGQMKVLYGKILLALRPFPQQVFRFCVKVKNQLAKRRF